MGYLTKMESEVFGRKSPLAPYHWKSVSDPTERDVLDLTWT